MARDPEAGQDQAEAAHDPQVDREAAVQGGHPGTRQDDRHSASVSSGVLSHYWGLTAAAGANIHISPQIINNEYCHLRVGAG